MERFFQILAVILAGVAAYFLWQGNADRAFAAAVFGAVSFFLSVRVQVKGRLKEREAARLEEEERRGVAEAAAEEEFEEDEDERPNSAAPQLNEIPAENHFDTEPRTTDHKSKL